MVWNRSTYRTASLAGVILLFCGVISCTVSYKFNGASIDYTKVKTITITEFPNQSPLVYAPLSQVFTEKLKDAYVTQTRLKFVQQDGDLNLSGQITGYELTPQAVKQDAYASETRLKITVRVNFSNSTNSDEDFEKLYSAYRDFSNEQMITDVQDALIQEICYEIADLIYNDTVAKW